MAAQGEEDVGPRTRRALRDRINETSLLNRCVDDIKRLLLPKTADFSSDRDVVTLQSDSGHQVASGVNYDGPDDYGDTLW
ncbi:hypothetical protein QFZ76_010296 [Streptomyces sp. V4I2]|nr:hypothetical protein [Streptomyces sp. V4I2]